MQVAVRHSPAFAVARLTLAPREEVRVESGAMMAMSPAVALRSKAEGGVLRSLKRAALGGESFFLTTYTAPDEGGWVDVAPMMAGDLITFEISPAKSWVISKGSWIASGTAVNLDTRWGGFRNLFGSEGGFVVHATGDGTLVASCYGALETWDLAPGQTITVDTGHMVAYEDTVQMNLRKVTGGLVQTFKSGEGIVFDFTGPGKVMTQTRNPNELLGFIQSAVGGGNSGGSIGGLFSRG